MKVMPPSENWTFAPTDSTETAPPVVALLRSPITVDEPNTLPWIETPRFSGPGGVSSAK